MFSQPSMMSKRASDPEIKCFEIDLSRSVPSDTEFTDATCSMIQDWMPYHNLMKKKGGVEREEIDEIASIKISGPMQKGTTEVFYHVRPFWKKIELIE